MLIGWPACASDRSADGRHPGHGIPRHRPVARRRGGRCGVSVGLGVYAKVHDPTGEQIAPLGFPSVLSMKAWLTTGVSCWPSPRPSRRRGCTAGCPASASPPRWIATAHRWTGTAAFLLALPVAYHCLWSLGWRGTDVRVVVHGVLGCAFFGALTTKLLALRIDGGRVGAAGPRRGLVAILTGVWLTSSLWFFTNVGFPGL